MSEIRLKLQPLTPTAFAPFGEVIEASEARHVAMNAGNFARYPDLASIDVDADAKVCVSIAVCQRLSSLPVSLQLVERHPCGSQAFVPLTNTPMVVVVARAGPEVGPADLSAFITNGEQGINYYRGVWHMPMIALEHGQRFLIIDRNGPGGNCDTHTFENQTVIIHE